MAPSTPHYLPGFRAAHARASQLRSQRVHSHCVLCACVAVLGAGLPAMSATSPAVVDKSANIPPGKLPPTAVSYAGREQSAPWRAAAEARIRKIRMGDITVVVQDSRGRPVPGARVRVRMLRHAFGFGSAVSAHMLLQNDPDSIRYQGMVTKLFNKAVIENALKWPAWEHNPQIGEQAVHWLRERGIAVRGHNLVWPSRKWLPRDITALINTNDKAALRRKTDDHITDEATALKGQIAEWDVVNEPIAEHDVMDLLGWDVIPEWYRRAHAADPAPQLYINDYGILSYGGNDHRRQDRYEQIIRSLIGSGAPLDGIGMQGHFDWRLTPPEKLLSILDRFARLGKPIEITEFDVNITDEHLQADYLRDFMTAVFSHPAVNGLMMWGFWEGRDWLPNAALFRKDWSIKPNGQEWMNLVFHQWWTDASGAANRSGVYRLRGFLGDYAVTVESSLHAATRRVTLTRAGTRVVMRLP